MYGNVELISQYAKIIYYLNNRREEDSYKQL